MVADRYRIEHTIGAGGNGAVHRAVHVGLDLPVAIKVLLLHACSPEDATQHVLRFSREARTTAGIRHRNILSVHDSGALDDGSLYLVMELIDGEDLEQRLRRGRLALPAVVDLGRQLFAALTAIAEAGVLHRDVKPANLMLRREADGQVLMKLVDFGIARTNIGEQRLTVTGVIIGTPHYMPPEQLRGEDLDLRSDLYAACAVLYEATTGRPPFDGPSAPLVIGQILGGRLTPVRELRPECPEGLAQLIERGLARNRDDRPAHPLELVAALDHEARAAGLPTGALAWADEPTPSGVHAHVGAPLRAGRVSPTRAHTTGDAVADTEEGPHGSLRASTAPRAGPARWSRRGLAAMLALAVVGGGLVAAGGHYAAAAAEPVAPTAPATLAVADTTAAVDALLDSGLEALARGEVEVALTHYRAATVADPNRPEAARGRGLAAARAGLSDEAIGAFERYLSLAPDAADGERVRDRLEVERTRRRAEIPSPVP
jgi:eukaryotic-like serine/threonine-protein kinase